MFAKLFRILNPFRRLGVDTGEAAGDRDAVSVRPQDSRLIPYEHGGAVHELRLSPDGRFLAVAGGGMLDRDRRKHQIFKEHFKVVIESNIPVFDTASVVSKRAMEPLHVQKGHTGPIALLLWEADGTLWSAGGDGTVRRHDLETGAQSGQWLQAQDVVLAIQPIRRRGITQQVPAVDDSASSGDVNVPEVSPSGEQEVADMMAPGASDSGTADAPISTEWFLQNVRESRLHEPPASTAQSPVLADAATHVWCVSADRSLRLVELETGRDGMPRVELGKHILTAAIFLGESALAYANFDGWLRVVDLQSLEVLFEKHFDEPLYVLETAVDGGFWSGDRLGKVRRHDESGRVQREAELLPGARILAMAESSDERKLAVGNIRGELMVVDPRLLHATEKLPPLASRVTALRFVGGALVAGDYAGFIYVMDPA